MLVINRQPLYSINVCITLLGTLLQILLENSMIDARIKLGKPQIK